MILLRPGARPVNALGGFAAVVLFAGTWLSGPVAAQPVRPAAPAASAAGDPADPSRPVPRLEHRSVLAAYRPAHEVPPIDWRTANETVNRIGGWRAYAREAAAPAPASPAASSPARETRR
jgi:hypothetical protein